MLNRRCKSYIFAEYIALTNKEYLFVEKAIDYIKRNKRLYARLVLTTTLMIHFNMNFVFASNILNLKI